MTLTTYHFSINWQNVYSEYCKLNEIKGSTVSNIACQPQTMLRIPTLRVSSTHYYFHNLIRFC